MFNRNRDNNKPQTKYQARYNEKAQIQVCEYNEETGLGLVLVGLFDNVGQYNKWLNANKISTTRVIWGVENDNADIEYSRKYAM